MSRAERRRTVRRVSVLVGVAALATACSGGHARTLGGHGVSLSLPHGWYGVSAPGQLKAADFPLARTVLSSAERARVRRGHVHVIVWDDSLEVWVQAYEEPRDHSLNPAMVTNAVVSLLVTVRSVTFTDPSAIVPLTVRLLNAMP